MKMKATIEFEYEAHPENYGTNDPVEMAKIDEDNLNNDGEVIFDFVSLFPFTAKVEPIC